MTPRRRALLIVLAALGAGLLLAAPALAAAGGGSGSFGGGGGGGGGGRGAGLYIVIQLLVRIAVLGHGIGALVILGLVIAYVLFARVGPGARRAWASHEQTGRRGRRRVKERSRRVTLAAAEAAEEDPAFAPDQVLPAATRLFTDIQAAWSAGDRRRLQVLVAPRLYAEWERRLDDFARRGWHNHVELQGEPTVEYVGLTHRGDADRDRVIVRIEATLHDYVTDAHGQRIKRAGHLRETVRTREFWTLGRRQGGWRLYSIEQGAEGAHALNEQIVATPWSDEQALRDEALVEQAAADAVPTGTDISELASVSFDGDARAAALDLSLADGRFAPDILAVAARRAVAAWAEAIDGDPSALRALTASGVLGQLLHPGDPSGATRLVVRGPKVTEIRIAAVEPAARPPAMTVDIHVEGRRYIEDRATTRVLSGDPNRAVRFAERWRLELTGDAAEPWRIAAVQTPVTAR